MSFEITTAFVQQYRDNVFHLSQQRGSRLRNAVMTEMVVGKTAFFERIGETTAQDKKTRHDDTPIVNTPHSRRRVALQDKVWADLIDKLDRVRLLINPESEYAQAGAWAMGRAIDDIIIKALNGDAFGGEDGATTIALPAAQKIAVGGTGLTIAKLRDTKQKLDEAEVDPEEPRFFATTAEQINNLLTTTEITSADFNTVRALVQGEVDTFMGFRFIRSERLLKVGTDRRCMAWAMTGMRLAIGQDMITRISERPDKNHATQVFLCWAMGATRVEETKVVEVSTLETA